MKALTLHQPWATLVALGAKQLETRSWSTSYRGPLAIHAAKQLPLVWRPFKDEHFVNALEPLCGLNEFGVPDLRKLPTGAVLAVVQLVDVKPLLPPFYDPEGGAVSDQERAFGDYGPGRYAWWLQDPFAFEPVPWRGRQRLWELPAAVVAW